MLVWWGYRITLLILICLCKYQLLPRHMDYINIFMASLDSNSLLSILWICFFCRLLETTYLLRVEEKKRISYGASFENIPKIIANERTDGIFIQINESEICSSIWPDSLKFEHVIHIFTKFHNHFEDNNFDLVYNTRMSMTKIFSAVKH